MREQRCGNCKFVEIDLGECRLNPPIWMKEEEWDQAGFGFPDVDPNHDWCGKWEKGYDGIGNALYIYYLGLYGCIYNNQRSSLYSSKIR